MKRILFGVGVSILLSLAAAVVAAEGNEAKAAEVKAVAAGPVDPKADEVIRRFCDYLSGIKSFRVEVASSTRMQAEGMNQEFATKTVVAMQKPDKLASVLQSGMMGATVVSDGKTVCTYIPMFGRYTVEAVKGSLSDIVEHPSIEGAGFPILRTLAAEKPYANLMEGVTNGLYVGIEELSGVKCHRLRFSQDELDWDVWIETGDRPLPRKFVPDFAKMMAAVGDEMPGPKGKSLKMEVTEALDNWQVNVDLPASQFTFTPPADAEKVDSFFGEGPEGQGDEAVHPLVGQPAPVFKLDTLEGKPFDFAAVKGKRVVLLDFWATWCGPCRRALPIIDEVASSFKDKGVLLVAVNQAEGADRIKEFIAKMELKALVALDREGRVGELYEVGGIPQTVIVGRDGKVQAVHVGFSPNLKEDLTREIEALLAGKDLAKETLGPRPAGGAVKDLKPGLMDDPAPAK